MLQPPFQLLYPLEDHAEVAQRVCGVEERIQFIAQPFAYVFVSTQQLPEAALTLPGPHRSILDHTVGLVSVHTALHKREQDAAREDDASSAVQVLQHAVLVDLETAQDAGCGAEHVEGQDRGVGEYDAFSRGVGDIPLLPEGVVLEADCGVRAQQPGHAAQALGQDRVPLVGHRRGALLPASERLSQLADLSSLGAPDLQRYLLHCRTEDGERGENLSVPVALHDLCRGRRRRESELLAGDRLDLRVDVRVGTDGARDLTHSSDLTRVRESVQVPLHLESPHGELVPEHRWLGVNPVRPSYHHGVPVLQRPLGIQHVGTCQAEVEVTGNVSSVLGDVGHERYYVVIGLSFYLVDTLDGEVRLLDQFLHLFGWDLPELRPRPADRKLHLEPGAILRLLGPDSPDLRECIALDHRLDSPPLRLVHHSDNET